VNAHDSDPQVANSRRQQRRLHHHELSRNQLLDAAEEVFGRKGFYETTLKEIVELAEFSVGSVYSFFESKDHLFQQVFRRRGEEYMPRLRAVLAGRGTALEVVHDLVDFEIGWFRDHPHFGRLWLRHAHMTMRAVDGLADQLIGAHFSEATRLQVGLLARGQAEGLIAPGDPAALARMLSGLVATFQSIDPLVVPDASDAVATMSVGELHALVERALRASSKPNLNHRSTT
jgi:TetR/AcrR family transcriptional regulator